MHSSWEKLCLCMRPLQRDKPYFPKGSQVLAPLDCSGSVQLGSEWSPSASKAAAPRPLPRRREGTLTHPDLRGQRRQPLVGGVIFHLFVASKLQEPIQTSKSGGPMPLTIQVQQEVARDTSTPHFQKLGLPFLEGGTLGRNVRQLESENGVQNGGG